MFGKVRRDAATRDDAVLSALAVRGCEGLRLLDHGQLSRSLRPVRLQRHPLQPRVARARRDLRDAQDHARPRTHQGRPRRLPVSRQSRRAARLGSCARLRPRAMADAAAARTRGLRHRDGRAALGAHVRRARRRGARHVARLARLRARRARRRRRHRPHLRARRSALLPADRGRHLARRRFESPPRARLDATRSTFAELVREMVESDWRLAQRDALVEREGLRRPTSTTNERRADIAPISSPAHAASWAPPFAARSRRAASAERGDAAAQRARSARPSGRRALLRSANGRSTCSWLPPRSAASSRTTPIRPTSSATISRSRPTSSTRRIRNGTREVLLSRARAASIRASRRSRCTESSLLTGPLEPTNQWYAVAKIAGIKMCQAYARQHGFNAISVMPTNLYGPGDNFDLQTSHVLPALLRKFHDGEGERRRRGHRLGLGHAAPRVPLRRRLGRRVCFPHGALRLARDHQRRLRRGRDDRGARSAHRRRSSASTGALVFDRSKPDGTPRKLLDVGEVRALGWQADDRRSPTASVRLTTGTSRTRRPRRLESCTLQKTLTRAVVPPSHHATSLNVLK